MKPPNIVTVHFLSTKWSKKLFTINHYEPQNSKCIVTQELSAYAKRKMSITYLLLDEYSRVLAIFAITHKAVQILGTNLSSTLQKKIQRYAQKNEKTDEYALSAFLIGQFGKNYQHKDAPVPDGGKMMEAVLTILKHVQREIGGGVVYLECEEKPELLNFYQNEKNRFRKFGERLSEKENVNYIQMLRIL